MHFLSSLSFLKELTGCGVSPSCRAGLGPCGGGGGGRGRRGRGQGRGRDPGLELLGRMASEEVLASNGGGSLSLGL